MNKPFETNNWLGLEQVPSMVRVKESEAINLLKPIFCMAIKKVGLTKSTRCFLIIEFVIPKESPYGWSTNWKSNHFQMKYELGSWESLERAKETYKTI